MLGLADGVYDVEVSMGRPNGASLALVTLDGVDLVGSRLANEPDALNGNASRTNRGAIRGGAPSLDFGQSLGVDYWFLNSLAVVGISPSSPDDLDDLWQVQHFGSATNTAATATTDPDGDGADNQHEFYFGTDPKSGASRPTTAASRSGPSSLPLQWTSRTNQVYQIEASADLTGWTVPLEQPAAPGATTSVTLAVAGGPTRGFYRVGAVAPSVSSWYPRPELNRDQRFRKPPLYPFELRGPGVSEAHSARREVEGKWICG